jgi:hypothetical protein
LKLGVPVANQDLSEVYGNSKKAAGEGIALVTFSRIAMACPGMGEFFKVIEKVKEISIIFFFSIPVLTPVLMTVLEKRKFLKRFPWANTPIQILFCGFW